MRLVVTVVFLFFHIGLASTLFIGFFPFIVMAVLLGFLPSAAVGALAYSAIKAMLETPEIVAWALILGGVLLLTRAEIKRGENLPQSAHA